MQKITFIYITNSSKQEARKIARLLVEKKLVGCANTFPVESMYWWEGKIVDEREWVLLAKTTEAQFGNVKREVERIHPYTVPCIVKIPVTANTKYALWLKDVTQHPLT